MAEILESPSADQRYLLERGWRLIMGKKGKYGKFYYWDHDQHQRRDGLWWTQGAAVMFQRRLERRSREARL